MADYTRSSSWKNLVEKDIPKNNHERRLDGEKALIPCTTALAGVGENAGKRGAGLPDEEAGSDEDDDEDD